MILTSTLDFIFLFVQKLILFYFIFSREDWDTLIDLRDPHFLAIAAAQQDLLNEYEDYAAENANGIACCRVITLVVCRTFVVACLFPCFVFYFGGLKWFKLIQLMLLLLLRHIFVVMKNIEMVQDISALFNVSKLYTIFKGTKFSHVIPPLLWFLLYNFFRFNFWILPKV